MCSIFIEERLERLERLTHDITAVDMNAQGDHYSETKNLDTHVEYNLAEVRTVELIQDESVQIAESSTTDNIPKCSADDGTTYTQDKIPEEHFHSVENHLENNAASVDSEADDPYIKEHSAGSKHEGCDGENLILEKIAGERHVPMAVLPLLRYYQYESSESSSRCVIHFSLRHDYIYLYLMKGLFVLLGKNLLLLVLSQQEN